MQTNKLYNSTSIISGNLYQIFTYVKNMDCSGNGNVSGVLLYAKTDEDITPDNDYMMGGKPGGIILSVIKLFWINPYLAECDAIITTVSGNLITLSQTIAYAFEGGQQSDIGTIGELRRSFYPREGYLERLKKM